MKFQKVHIRFNLILILIGISASALMYWTMAYGPGISPDSTTYFMVARNLLAGNGFYGGNESVAHYPPVYPLLLATVNIFETGDDLQASRLMHAILFGAYLCLVIYAIRKSTENNFWASTFALLLLLSSSPLILIYSMAWSESPFMVLCLLAFLLFSSYIIRPSIKLLLAASVTCGLAIATRYIGVALLPTIVFSIVLFGNRSIRYKIRDTIIAVAVSCLPISIWVIRNLVVTQSATDRTFAIHPISLVHIEALIETLYFFVFPVQAPGWVQDVLIFGIAMAFLMSIPKIRLSQMNSSKESEFPFRFVLFSLCLTFFISYIAFLFLSISFFDAHTPLDFRILSPAFLALIIASTVLTWYLFQSPEQKLIKWGLLCLAIVSIALNFRGAVSRIIDVHENGRGYSSRFWRNSETISYMKSIPTNDSIFTNGVDVLRFWTGVEAMVLPKKMDSTTLIVNRDYKVQLENLCNDVKKGNAMIVFFNSIERSNLPRLGELKSRCDIPPLMEFNDGVIFGKQVRTNFE